MSEDTSKPEPGKLTEAQLRAKARLDSSIAELGKAVQNTPLALGANAQLQLMQLDVLVDLLAESGLFQREEFWKRITEKVDHYTSECRRALLSQGGASALAGLRKPGGH